jgi:hypothetical protein
MSGIILLRLDEGAKLQPSDSLGNLGDLGTEPGIIAPSRVSAWSGAGRQFAQSITNGVLASDRSSNGTLLQRDITIQALISLTLTAASGPQTVIARGTNDGTPSEYYAYGLELQEQAGFPGFIEVRWFWQDSTGAIKTQAPGVFQHAGDGAEFMLTATRRRELSSRVVVRYYVNDQLLAEFVSPDGDIAGGTTGHTTVGARKSAGAYGRHLNGVIDELLVTDDEMSLEEIRYTWLRLTEHQPGGVETLIDLLPDVKWFRDPGSDIGAVIKVAGQLLGLAAAAAEAIRALTLPDAAGPERLAQWERFCELSPAPGDSLDVRRARVIAYLQRAEGFQLDAIRTALAGPMDLRPDQVEVVEYTNIVTDDFSAGIAGERWLNGGGGATWSTTDANELQATAPAGADLRWESRATPWLLTAREPGRLFVQTKLSSFAALPQSVGAALALHNRHSGDWLWFGVYNNAGTLQVSYRLALAGQPGGAVNALTNISAGPMWLRISTSQAQTWIDDGSIMLTYSTSSPTAGLVNAVINSGSMRGWLWAGFALFSTVAATPAATTVAFDDWFLHDRDSLRPFCWYAYRDPALPGHPDMIGADRTVKKIKPAYTHAAAITSKSLLYGSGLYGGGPMGGGLPGL